MQSVPNQKGIEIITMFSANRELLLPPGKYVGIIPQQQRDDLIKRMNEDVTREKFCVSIDVQTGELNYILGVEQWLGYSHQDFNTKKYFEITHPAHAVPQWIIGSCVFSLM